MTTEEPRKPVSLVYELTLFISAVGLGRGSGRFDTQHLHPAG